MNAPVQKRKSESGQAVVLVIAALSIFLMAAIGLAIDGSDLYAQRQAAQAAADAAAQAGIMSIFDGTNTTGPHAFPPSAGAMGPPYTCATAAPTPCYYAETLNGFNKSGDTVTYTPLFASGGVFSGSDPVNELQVVVTRQVPATLMRLLGWTTIPVSATGTAAIVQIMSPVPIIVTHPTMADALLMNGNANISIVGGPQRSIQVNSNGTNPAGAAFSGPSSGWVDLSSAGPANNGGDFGTFGGPSSQPGQMNFGSRPGKYISPASPIQDPLAGVYPDNWSAGYPNGGPPLPTGSTPPASGQSCSLLGHCTDCPIPGSPTNTPTTGQTCTEYLPGVYNGGLNVTNVSSAIFDPGLYYIRGGGFTLKNSTAQMCFDCTPDANTAMGMVVYDTGTAAQPTKTGGFDVDTLTSANLWGGGITMSGGNMVGSPAAPYYGILFFEDRHADAHTSPGLGSPNHTHVMGTGNGCFSVVGTVYITNELSIMLADPSHYQAVSYGGTPCSNTLNEGEIIVSELTVEGTADLNMRLYPTSYLKVRQVALVQ